MGVRLIERRLYRDPWRAFQRGRPLFRVENGLTRTREKQEDWGDGGAAAHQVRDDNYLHRVMAVDEFRKYLADETDKT